VRIPDIGTPWILPAIRFGKALTRRMAFDLVISSGGPPSSHLVAFFIVRSRQLPWIADYRDLWSENYNVSRNSIFEYLEKIFERRIIRKATCLTTVSKGLKGALERLHNKRVVLIYNGYDEPVSNDGDVFEEVNRRVFRIVYTGNVYISAQDPSLLISAINDCIKRKENFGCEFELYFVGTHKNALAPILDKCKPDFDCHIIDRVSHQESMRWQRSADALLLLGWLRGGQEGVLTGKVFEYIAAKRPVIALLKPYDELGSILSRSNTSKCIYTIEDMQPFLRELLVQRFYLQKKRLDEDLDHGKFFSRFNQVKVLDALISEVCVGSR
jgi:glycosyltransferase involved in cell wall biosynthesis